MKTEVRRDKQGRKLYPVCRWERNQHKIYNAYDRAYVRMIEDSYSQESVAELDRASRAMELIDSNIYDGIVYATWEDGLILKSYIGSYNARH